jgi:hypothetical protein
MIHPIKKRVTESLIMQLVLKEVHPQSAVLETMKETKSRRSTA